MAEKTIRIAYIDRVWYDAEKKQILGDMGFSFEDSSDTRQLESEIDEMRESCQDWIDNSSTNSYGMEEFGNGRDSDFAIYELCTADATYDDEDFDGKPIQSSDLWRINCIDNVEVVDVYVCAKKEDAEFIIDEEYGMWVGKHYAEVE